MQNITVEATQVLEARRRALLDQARAEKRQKEETGPFEDRSDQIDADELSEVVDRLSQRQRSELIEIDAALARLKAGSFGLCEACGQAIGRQRLRALPEARYCLNCAAHAKVA